MELFSPFPKIILKKMITDVFYDFTVIRESLDQKYVDYMNPLEKEVLELYYTDAKKKLSKSLIHKNRVYITTRIFVFSFLAVDLEQQFFLNLMDDVQKSFSKFNDDQDIFYDIVPHIWFFDEMLLKKHSLISSNYALDLANGFAEENCVDSSLFISKLALTPRKKPRSRNEGN